jgi:hypothetical protein
LCACRISDVVAEGESGADEQEFSQDFTSCLPGRQALRDNIAV